MFLVLGLPRSRTFWLSKFLSYGDFECGHDEAAYLRTIEDAKAWLRQEYHGSCETAIAPFWRLAREINPKLKFVVVERPVHESVASWMALNMNGVCAFDEGEVAKYFTKLAAKLRQITHRTNALCVKYADLNDESWAQRIFEFCLPYKFDRAWWHSLAQVNLQRNVRAQMRYAITHKDSLDRMIKTATHLSHTQLVARPAQSSDGVTFQQESFDAWERDGVPLFEAHCVEVGESPDNWKNKNIPLMRKLYDVGAMQITTARCNGRMFGYLMAVISPSLETRSFFSGFHTTFYASRDMPGLGLKLQRSSVAALKQRGVGEVAFLAGARADGPRMGVLYNRLGAEKFGDFYRLKFSGV